MGLETALFWVFAVVAVGCSLLVIGQRNPIYSVLLLIGSFGALSGLYILLEAPFVAVIQIIVYAGAILVLFLFVVMLLNVPKEDASEYDRAHPTPPTMVRPFGAFLAVLLVVQLVWAVVSARRASTELPIGGPGDEALTVGSVRLIGRTLFTDYAFPFEVTSILILVAMVGAVVLARRFGEETR